MTVIVEVFVDQLKQARLDRAWTQASLAAAVGISENYYRSIEAGRVLPSADLLRRVMIELFVSDPAEIGFKLVVTESVAHVG